MPTSNTIADIVLANSGENGRQAFDILLQALVAADPDSTGLLAAAADPNQDLTVFAPTDDAFINLAQVIDPSISDEGGAVGAIVAASQLLSPADDPLMIVRTILSYHISVGGKTLAELGGINRIETLAGVKLKNNGDSLGDKEPDLTNPAFVDGLTDLAADNGIVHVIDNVLLPFDITFAEGGYLNVGRGNDAVIGSSGRDYLVLGRGDDVANGAGGNDIIFGGRGNDVANGGDGNDKIFGGRGNDMLGGGDGHDYLFGGRGRDDLSGGDGNDRMFGGSGSDSLDGGEGHDYLVGGRGHDDLNGGEGNDRLYGGHGRDNLDGGNGHDYLSGGRGHDTLTGGSGDDYLFGGMGADKFVFNPNNLGDGGAMNEGNDFIADFNPGRGDKLVLDVSTFDQATIDTVSGLAGDENILEVVDLLADLDPATEGVQSVISLGGSSSGNLVISHPAGTIEFGGIPADIDPAVLIPAVEFILPESDFELA